MSKVKDFRCMESQLRDFLSHPRSDMNTYKMPKDAEIAIRKHVQILNKMFPKMKIKTKSVIKLVKELYVHPIMSEDSSGSGSRSSKKGTQRGGGKGRQVRLHRLTRGKRSGSNSDRSLSRSRSRSRSNGDIVEFQYAEPKSYYMNIDIIMAIIALVVSIYLAYIAYERALELNDMTNASGHIGEMGKSILEEFKKMPKETITFLGFWFKYFQNLTCNVIQKEADILKDTIVKIGTTVAEDMMVTSQASCNMNPTKTVDWVTSYMNPSGVAQCLNTVRTSITTAKFAQLDLLNAHIQKNASDIGVLANYAAGMASTSIGYLTFRLQPPKKYNIQGRVRKTRKVLN